MKSLFKKIPTWMNIAWSMICAPKNNSSKTIREKNSETIPDYRVFDEQGNLHILTYRGDIGYYYRRNPSNHATRKYFHGYEIHTPFRIEEFIDNVLVRLSIWKKQRTIFYHKEWYPNGALKKIILANKNIGRKSIRKWDIKRKPFPIEYFVYIEKYWEEAYTTP